MDHELLHRFLPSVEMTIKNCHSEQSEESNILYRAIVIFTFKNILNTGNNRADDKKSDKNTFQTFARNQKK